MSGPSDQLRNGGARRWPAPIPTAYAGHLFRSRLEARWAVFFDALKISWQYKSQGYYVGGSCAGTAPRAYLPDFYLPSTETWVEVKGTCENFDWELLAEAVDWGCGLPGIQDSAGHRPSARGLLLLGPIPHMTVRPPIHPILQHYKGGVINGLSFVTEDQKYRTGEVRTNLLLRVECMWVVGGCFSPHDRFDIYSDGQIPLEKTIRQYFSGDNYVPGMPLSVDVRDAYRAARSARFEHGQFGGML